MVDYLVHKVIFQNNFWMDLTLIFLGIWTDLKHQCPINRSKNDVLSYKAVGKNSNNFQIEIAICTIFLGKFWVLTHCVWGGCCTIIFGITFLWRWFRNWWWWNVIPFLSNISKMWKFICIFATRGTVSLSSSCFGWGRTLLPPWPSWWRWWWCWWPLVFLQFEKW